MTRAVLAALAYAALLALAVKAPVVAIIATALALWLWGVCTDASRERDVTVDLLAWRPDDERGGHAERRL